MTNISVFPAPERERSAAETAASHLIKPHGGELVGPASVRRCIDSLHADRLGHGVRSVEDPDLLARLVDAGIALEICPVSNVALGVYSDLTSVPLPTLLEAGATVALGADDPLLFGSRLAGQYTTMRAAHDLSDETLARLAAMSVQAQRSDLSADDRLHLHYALGKAYEDKGDHGASFEHYARGAALRRATAHYSADANHSQMLRSKRLFTREFFAARDGAG